MKKLLLTFILVFSTIQLSLASEITDSCRTDIDRTNYTAITSTIQEVVLNIGDALHKKIINKDYDYQISYFGKVIELLDNIENNIGTLTPSKKQILGLLKQQVECKVGYINTSLINTNTGTTNSTTTNEEIDKDPILGIENLDIIGIDQDYSIPIDTSGAVSVKDYGAVGDGIANDTQAIQNALNSNSKVYFPEGTYRVTGGYSGISDTALVLKSINKLVYGEGIIFLDDTSVYAALGNARESLTDFILDGITIINGPLNIKAYDAIYLHNVTIQHCTFLENSQSPSKGLSGAIAYNYNGINGLNYFNNTFINGTKGACGVVSRFDDPEPENAIWNVTFKGNHMTYDIDEVGSGTSGRQIAVSFTQHHNSVISHNYIEGYPSMAIEAGEQYGSIIEYNDIINTLSGINFYFDSNNGIIKNNRINIQSNEGALVIRDASKVVAEHNDINGLADIRIHKGTDLPQSVEFNYNKIFVSGENKRALTIFSYSNINVKYNYFDSELSNSVLVAGLSSLNNKVENNDMLCYNSTDYIYNLSKNDIGDVSTNNFLER